jgi:hypothetical protein
LATYKLLLGVGSDFAIKRSIYVAFIEVLLCAVVRLLCCAKIHLLCFFEERAGEPNLKALKAPSQFSQFA